MRLNFHINQIEPTPETILDHAHVQFLELRQWLGVMQQLEALHQMRVIDAYEVVKMFDSQTVMRRADDQLPQILCGAAPFAALKIHKAQIFDVAGEGVAQQDVARPQVPVIKNLELLWIIVKATCGRLHKLISCGLQSRSYIISY